MVFQHVEPIDPRKEPHLQLPSVVFLALVPRSKWKDPSLQHWLNPYPSHDATMHAWCPHQPLPRHSSAGLVAKRWLPSCAYPSRGVQRCDAWLSEAIKEAVCCREFIHQLYPNKGKATKWKLSSWIFLRHFHAKHFHHTNRHRACSKRLSTSGLVGHWQRPRRLHVRSQTVLPSSSPGKNPWDARGKDEATWGSLA